MQRLDLSQIDHRSSEFINRPFVIEENYENKELRRIINKEHRFFVPQR